MAQRIALPPHPEGKVLVVLSGGLDSAVLAAWLAQRAQVVALSVDYGQRHRRELESAHEIALHLGLTPLRATLPSLGAVLGGSALTDKIEVPEGHYAEDSMKATVVPNRNMILLAIAGGVAIAQGCWALAYGAHAGDHAIYPDCRPAFADAMVSAFQACHYEPLSLLRPFIGITKADIVALGDELGVPMGLTWSCYKGGVVHCGACGTCCERREAFDLARVPDPTFYADDAPPLPELLARAPVEV